MKEDRGENSANYMIFTIQYNNFLGLSILGWNLESGLNQDDNIIQITENIKVHIISIRHNWGSGLRALDWRASDILQFWPIR